MKTKGWLAFSISLILIPFAGISQCSTTIQQVSFDTTVTGFGATDVPFNFTFPQFDGTLGTLTEVKLTSQVSLTYHYDIENTLTTPKDHQLRIERYDDLQSSSLIGGELSTSYTSGWLHNSLQASDGVTGSGPDFKSVAPFYLVNNYTIIDETLYNTADFLGAGTVSFDYSTSMFRTSNPATGASITNDASADAMTFSVTYTYCSNLILASNITSFTASKNDGSVNLRWSTTNERSDKRYELLKSYDGKNFTSVKEFPAFVMDNQSGNYQYNYIPVAGEQGKLIFRVKEIERSGDIKYSALRAVDLGTVKKKTGIRLVPNPTKGDVTVILDNAVRSDWDVQIFNIKGQVVRNKQVTNALLVKLNMDEKLGQGIYFVMALNKKTKEKFVERLLVN